MKDFVVFPKRRRMIMLSILAIIFTVLGLLFIGLAFADDFREDMVMLLVIGLVCAVFFGLGSVYFIYVLIKHKPALIVTNEGIIDQSSFIEAGLVRWEEIADIQFYEYGGQVFLGIFTHNPNLIIDRTSGIKKALNRINKGLIDAQVNIPAKNLDCDMEELVEVIDSRWNKSMQSDSK